MRRLLPLLLIGCGAPAFVPVTFTLDGPWAPWVIGSASKKVNPSCVMNCELAQSIEDGGCSDIRINSAGVFCTPGGAAGGLFVAFDAADCDGGYCQAAHRNIAPGSTLGVIVSGFEADSGCGGEFTVPAGPMSITIAIDGGFRCSTTSSP